MRKLPALLALTVLLVGCGTPESAEQGQTLAASNATQTAQGVAASSVAQTALPAAPTPTALPGLLATLPATLSRSPVGTQVPTPPLPPPLVAAILPFAGLIGGLDGAVVAPGYRQAPEVFQGFIAIRVDIRDPAALQGDDGIEAVTFQITREDADGSSIFVYEKVETTQQYCLFGGDDPACNPIQLVNGASWPNGTPIIAGNYRIQIDVTADDRAKGASWNALFKVELY